MSLPLLGSDFREPVVLSHPSQFLLKSPSDPEHLNGTYITATGIELSFATDYLYHQHPSLSLPYFKVMSQWNIKRPTAPARLANETSSPHSKVTLLHTGGWMEKQTEERRNRRQQQLHCTNTPLLPRSASQRLRKTVSFAGVCPKKTSTARQREMAERARLLKAKILATIREIKDDEAPSRPQAAESASNSSPISIDRPHGIATPPIEGSHFTTPISASRTTSSRPAATSHHAAIDRT